MGARTNFKVMDTKTKQYHTGKCKSSCLPLSLMNKIVKLLPLSQRKGGKTTGKRTLMQSPWNSPIEFAEYQDECRLLQSLVMRCGAVNGRLGSFF